MMRICEAAVSLKKIILIKPRGFCAGVVRAVDIVDEILKVTPPPIYIRKEIVHNAHVVNSFREKGVIFVNEIHEIPENSTAVFSAHGVSPEVRRQAKEKNLHVIDATCPLVTKVHLEALRFVKEGYTILLIGHAGHEEVEGTMGESPEHTILVTSKEDAEILSVPDPDKLVYLTQTTLSIDDTQEIVGALKKRFPKLHAPPKDDICYATQNRQNAVKALTGEVDLMLVIGAQNSSNAKRLVEVAKSRGMKAYLLADARALQPSWFEGCRVVGITASASTPEVLFEELVKKLKEYGPAEVSEFELLEENVSFALPSELQAVP